MILRPKKQEVVANWGCRQSWFSFLFSPSKCRGICTADTPNTDSKAFKRKITVGHSFSWDQGRRGHSSSAWYHLDFWTLELQFRYHRFQVHICHIEFLSGVERGCGKYRRQIAHRQSKREIKNVATTLTLD